MARAGHKYRTKNTPITADAASSGPYLGRTIAYFDDFLREEFKIRMMIKAWPDTSLFNRKSALTSVKQFRVELAMEMNS